VHIGQIFCLRIVSVSFRASLEDRLKLEENSGISNMVDTAVGSKQLTFTLKKVQNSFNVKSTILRMFPIVLLQRDHANIKHLCTVDEVVNGEKKANMV